MSIFRDTVKPWTATQIKMREYVTSQGFNGNVSTINDASIPIVNNTYRDNKFFKYNSKVPWIRLTSFVDINGSSLAAQTYILKNGTSYYSGSIDKQASTFLGGQDGSYINKRSRQYDVGIVPQPGIESLSIKSLTAYGSLRDINLVYWCHNKLQFDQLELLYQRPGYSVLVEWGWSTYLRYNGDQNPDTGGIIYPTIADINKIGLSGGDRENIQALDLDFNGIDVFRNNWTQDSLYDEIDRSVEEYQGNYDAFYGIIKNFSWRFGPDNKSYRCELQAISRGEVISTINPKINSPLYDIDSYSNFFYDSLSTNKDKGDVPLDTTLVSVLKNVKSYILRNTVLYSSSNASTDSNQNSTNSNNTSNRTPQPFNMNSGYKPTNINNTIPDIGLTYVNNSDLNNHPLKDVYSSSYKFSVAYSESNPTDYVISQLSAIYPIDNNVDLCYYPSLNPSKDGPSFDSSYNTYIRLPIFLAIINYYIIPKNINYKYTDNKGDKMLYLLIPPTSSSDYSLGCTNSVSANINVSLIGNSFANDIINLVNNYPRVTDNVLPPSIYVNYEGDPIAKFDLNNDIYKKDRKGGFNPNVITAGGDPKIKTSYSDLTNYNYIDKVGPTYVGKLENIWINIDYLINTISNINSNSNLIDYVTTILNGVSDSLGGINNFKIWSDNNIARIIDVNYLETNSQYDDKYLFNVFGMNSVVNRLSIESKIFESQATMMAIGAGNKANIGDLYTSTVSYLNKGLTSRIYDDVNYVNYTNTSSLDLDKTYRDNLITLAINLSSYLQTIVGKYNSSQISNSSQVTVGGGISTPGVPVSTNISGTTAGDYLVYKPSLINNNYSINSILKTFLLQFKNTGLNYKAIIPFELTLRLEGISGFVIGQIFRISDNVMPTDYITKRVGIIITGISQYVDNKGSAWYTELSCQCCLLGTDDYDETTTENQNNYTNSNLYSLDKVVEEVNNEVYSDFIIWSAMDYLISSGQLGIKLQGYSTRFGNYIASVYYNDSPVINFTEYLKYNNVKFTGTTYKTYLTTYWVNKINEIFKPTPLIDVTKILTTISTLKLDNIDSILSPVMTSGNIDNYPLFYKESGNYVVLDFGSIVSATINYINNTSQINPPLSLRLSESVSGFSGTRNVGALSLYLPDGAWPTQQ